MAAFSYQHHSLLVDPFFLQNTSGFSQNSNTITTIPSFPNYPVEFRNNEASVTNKNSPDSSSVLDHNDENGDQVTLKVIPMAQKRSNSDGCSMSSVQFMEARELKGKKQKKWDGVRNDEKEKKPNKAGKKDEKIRIAEEVPTDYVHVRARRGQATDSHSLAERVRREKISERMKMLQALVPGCDKMTGKALILDEIINYVQSLQNKVEFLSMKLSSVNSMSCDAFLVSSERMESPLPNVQQCNSAQPIAFPHSPTNTFTPPDSYPLLDTMSSLLFDQQMQFPNILQPRDNGQLLWDVDEQRQKLINQSEFSNHLCSFH